MRVTAPAALQTFEVAGVSFGRGSRGPSIVTGGLGPKRAHDAASIAAAKMASIGRPAAWRRW